MMKDRTHLKGSLTGILLLACIPFAVRAASPLFSPPGLVAWWSADGNARDIFGGYPGELVNGTTFSNGIVGQCFSFDGTNDYVRTDLDAQPEAMPYTTWEAWVYPQRLDAGNQPILSINDGGLQRMVRIQNGNSKFAIMTGTGFWAPVNATSNQWQHIAVVYSPTNILFYRNGVLYSYGSAPLPVPSSAKFHIGRAPVSTSGFFQGMVDEVAVYNRVLSTAEIQSIYNAGAAGKFKAPAPMAPVYASDFSQPVGSEWSVTNLSVTPVNARAFLGPFANQSVTLTLTNLPAHTNLNLEVDLFIMKTWDGSPVDYGPDVWDLSVVGGQTLLHTTFDNPGPPTPQAYPEAYPGGLYPPLTGALEVNTLGYNRDSVYRLNYTLAHSASSATLRFSGAGLQGLTDESWGLERVMVTSDGPSIAFVSLTNDAVFATPANLDLNVTAGANTAYVNFLADNVLLGTLTNAPYTFTWTNPPGGLHVVKAVASDGAGRTATSMAVVRVNGLLGEYFSNTNLSGAPIQRIDPAVAFDWDLGAPISGISTDGFSVRWSGEISPRYSDVYTFYTTANDGVRLWVNGQRLVEDWQSHSAQERSGTIQLQADARYTIQLEYFEGPGSASVILEWESANQARQIVPGSRLFPPVPGVNRSPNAPYVIRPAEGSAINPTADKVLAADFYSDLDPGDFPIAADWQIWAFAPLEVVWTCSTTDPALLLTNDLARGTFVNSFAGRSALEFGRDYVVRVRHRDSSGATNSWGNWSERFFNTRPPGFSMPAPSYQATVGENVNLYASVTNILPWVTYQWLSNGVAIPNATNADLFLRSVQLFSAASYALVAQNPAGAVTSAPAALTVVGGLTVLAQNTFDSSREGWTIEEDSSNPVTIKYGTGAGNDGGGIYGVENAGNGGTWYFVASTNYFGNRSAAYGGYIEYHQRRTRVSQLYSAPDVVLFGDGLKLVVDMPYPGLDWTHLRVGLHETNGWRHNNLNGPAATSRDMLRVLSALTNMWIRGEYNDNADSCYLDNVRLLATECTPGTILRTHYTTNQLVLEWPTNACGFVLQSSAAFGASWVNYALAQGAAVSNGLNVVSINLTNTTRFYRLSKP